MKKKLPFIGIIIVILLTAFFVLVLNRKENLDEIALGDKRYLVGDINDDGKVNTKDYTLLRKHILKKSLLTGEQLIRADVDGKNGVSVADYTAIRKIILSGTKTYRTLNDSIKSGVSYSSSSNDESLSGSSYEEVISADFRVVDLGDSYEVYTYDVTDSEFGADPTGKTDSTAAFKKAIQTASKCIHFGRDHGGNEMCSSVIYVPEGSYILTDSISLGSYVELIGSPNNKSILLIKHGEGLDYNWKSAIMADCMSSIKNIVFYYPDQKLDQNGKAVKYPPTILYGYSTSQQILSYPSDGISLENVFFINSYTAMDFSTANGNNSVFFLKNIYGTPLKLGLLNDENIDTIKMENINFSSKYWTEFSNKKILGKSIDSVLKNVSVTKVSESLIKKSLKNTDIEPTGINLQRVDWALMANVNISGYHTGIRLSNSKMSYNRQVDGGRYVNTEGEIYDSKITDCKYPVHIVNSRHFVFTNVTLDSVGGIALKVDNNVDKDKNTYNVDSEYSIYNSTISNYNFSANNTNNYAIDYGGKGPISITNSKVYGKINIQHSSNLFSFSGSTLLNTGMDSVTHDPSNTKCYVESTPTLTKDLPKNYLKSVKTKPKSSRIEPVKISKGSYEVDITKAIRNAIDALGSDGGIVFIPNGKYTLSDTITVPSGVEIQGATSWAHHSRYLNEYATNVGSTVIDITPLNGKTAFKLNASSGITGLDIVRETKLANSNYVIDGSGANIYVKNISLPGLWNGIHINGKEHLIEHIWGAVYNIGIKVEENDGIIRNCHFTPKSLVNRSDSSLGQEVRNNSTTLYVGSGSGETIFHVFTIGQKYALKLDGAKNVNVIGLGVDGDTLNSIEANNSSGKIINAHLVTGVDGIKNKKEDYRYIKSTNSNLEIINSIDRANTNATAFEFNGGEVKVFGGIIKHYQTQAILSSNTKLAVVGAIFVNSGPKKINVSTTSTSTVNLYGNICLNGNGGIDSCASSNNLVKKGNITVTNFDYKVSCKDRPISKASTQWLTLNLRKTSAYKPLVGGGKEGVTTICGFASGYKKFKYKTMQGNTTINTTKEVNIKNGCVDIAITPKPNLVFYYQLSNDTVTTEEYKVPDIGKYLIFAQEYNYWLYADRDVNKNIASNDLNNLTNWVIKDGKVSDLVRTIAGTGIKNKTGYTDKEFVEYAYHGIFGRAVDPDGLDTWTKKLQTMSRTDLVNYYISHTEAQNLYKGWGYN